MWEVIICQCCNTIIAFMESEKTGTLFGQCEQCKENRDDEE